MSLVESVVRPGIVYLSQFIPVVSICLVQVLLRPSYVQMESTVPIEVLLSPKVIFK